jgi:thiosulfate reductase cytochrome b subunit
MILLVHPRFYWGEVGNDLTPALFELPISRNYQHGGWENSASFFDSVDSPVSASRTYDIFNQNSWGRSLHFLAAWILVLTGVVYLLAGLFTGHFKQHLWPRANEFTLQLFWRDIRNHWRLQIPAPTYGPQYGLLQKCSYLAVIFFLLPLVVLTGLTMSPAITAAYPFLLKMFFGAQSARTIHFFASVTLVLFLLVHVAMVIQSGFKQQIRAMTLGK